MFHLPCLLSLIWPHPINADRSDAAKSCRCCVTPHTHTLRKCSLTQYWNRDQCLAIAHVQERSADRSDPQALTATDTDAVPAASTLATAENPDMPATMADSSTPRKERPPVVITANDRVKVYSMMHPGQRQHQLARLKVHNQVLLRSCTRWQNSCVPLSCFAMSAGILHP